LSFKDIKGQDRAVSFLRSTIDNGRVSSAYLFSGPSGVGKKLTAVNFAKALNCVADTGLRPCDVCAPCKKVAGRNHPDVSVVEVAEDERSIKIDMVRSVMRDMGLRPYEARKKVYIIDSADTMTDEAQNAFLKTLEEPPSGSVIILVADRQDALLPTIRSRSQEVRFFPLDPGIVEEALVSAYGVDPAGARILSRISSGSIGKALEYKDGDYLVERSRVIAALRDGSLFDKELEDAPREKIKRSMEIMLSWYRDLLIAKAGGVENAFVNVDMKDDILIEAGKTSFDRIESAIEEIIVTGSSIDQNANPKLAISVLEYKI